jgi:hypothetical protein
MPLPGLLLASGWLTCLFHFVLRDRLYTQTRLATMATCQGRGTFRHVGQNSYEKELRMATTREVRREELRLLLVAWEAKRDPRIWDLFDKATGVKPGEVAAPGTLVFQTILDHEFGTA